MPVGNSHGTVQAVTPAFLAPQPCPPLPFIENRRPARSACGTARPHGRYADPRRPRSRFHLHRDRPGIPRLPRHQPAADLLAQHPHRAPVLIENQRHPLGGPVLGHPQRHRRRIVNAPLPGKRGPAPITCPTPRTLPGPSDTDRTKTARPQPQTATPAPPPCWVGGGGQQAGGRG